MSGAAFLLGLELLTRVAQLALQVRFLFHKPGSLPLLQSSPLGLQTRGRRDLLKLEKLHLPY